MKDINKHWLYLITFSYIGFFVIELWGISRSNYHSSMIYLSGLIFNTLLMLACVLANRYYRLKENA